MEALDRSADSIAITAIDHIAGDHAMSSTTTVPRLALAVEDPLVARIARLTIVSGAPRSAFYESTKRILDVAVGSLLLLIALPIMLVTGILVRIDSPGPIVFRQDRIGRGGKPFVFYKFRTMYADARQRFPQLYAYRFDPETVKKMRYKEVDDPRLTRIGRWLRRTSLDELPNLFNVLGGDVTLIGPRPEIYEWLPYYADSQLIKFSVKPGVTGFAQIHGRSLLTFQEVLAEDVRYVHSRSLRVDLKVLALTVKEVLIRQGAF
jgi:lipopolysaccharide/colanic/teichoic acid biosynthesis glycosyltransferase